MARTFILGASVLFAAAPWTCFGETPVSGDIREDATWTLAGSPYWLTGSVFIYGADDVPVRLTIEAGVEVIAEAGCGIVVGQGPGQTGRLLALGTTARPVVFTAAVKAPGAWEGLTIRRFGGEERSSLSGCRVEYAGGVDDQGSIRILAGAGVTGRAAILEDCTVAAGSGPGLHLRGCVANVARCVFSGNALAGIVSEGCRSTITDCFVTGNGSGISCIASARPKIANCTVASNSGAGIAVAASQPEIVNAIFWANGIPPEGLDAGMVSFCDIEGPPGAAFAGTDGNISQDPRFVQPGTDFHLGPGSPCIGAGTGDRKFVSEWDIDYQYRLGIPDIGADETVEPGANFRRGDVDGNGRPEITDPIVILGWLFLDMMQPPCLDAADANDDSVLSMADALYILYWLFKGGPEPPAPGPFVCGLDMTPVFGCASYPQSACR